MFVGCSAKGCQANIFEIRSTDKKHIHKVVTLPAYGKAGGGANFCKDHLKEADESIKNWEPQYKLKASTIKRMEEEDRMGAKKEDKDHKKEDKATQKYSDMARRGLSHHCSLALLDLRAKQSATGFESVAELYSRVSYDIEDYESEIMDSLLGKDTPDRRYYKSFMGK